MTAIAVADGDPIIFEDLSDGDGAGTSGQATIVDVAAGEYRLQVAVAGADAGPCGGRVALDHRQAPDSLVPSRSSDLAGSWS